MASDKLAALERALGVSLQLSIADSESAIPDEGPLRDLLDLLLPDRAFARVAHLPAGYQERYEARLTEIRGRVHRELDEYLKVLEAEFEKERTRRHDRREGRLP